MKVLKFISLFFSFFILNCSDFISRDHYTCLDKIKMTNAIFHDDATLNCVSKPQRFKSLSEKSDHLYENIDDFSKKFISDSLLKGSWSKVSYKKLQLHEAESYCSSLNGNWRLPDNYEIKSLAYSKTSKKLFYDETSFDIWSKQPYSYDTFFLLLPFEIISNTLYKSKHVRCFSDDMNQS